MSETNSTKPYMIRAIHEWCVDNAMTPHLLVVVDERTRVPVGYVKNGEIVLNINYTAVKDLHIGNDAITFAARFNGAPMDLYVPIEAVRGIFSRENGQGMFFEVTPSASMQTEEDADIPLDGQAEGSTEKDVSPKPKKPTLTIVK